MIKMKRKKLKKRFRKKSFIYLVSNIISKRYSSNNMKNRVKAGLLGAFLGSFGAHRFYLGEIGSGFLYLIFFWTGIPGLIGIIDGIVLLSMGEREFDIKYNFHLINSRNYSSNANNYRNTYGQPETSTLTPPTPKPANKSNKFKIEGTKLYKNYDFKGAIEAYIKSLKVQPNDPQINFNLACLYSLEENTNAAYIHLQRAVEQGYSNFDKIKTHDHLAYLRTNPQFDSFVKNGYVLAKEAVKEEPKVEELTNEDFEKLERLATLRDKGILTEEEFQAQKNRLLS